MGLVECMFCGVCFEILQLVREPAHEYSDEQDHWFETNALFLPDKFILKS